MTRHSSARPRIRRSVGHKYIASGSRSHIPTLRAWARQVDVAQRRHASSGAAVELSPQPALPPAEETAWLRTFDSVAEGADAFSADDAWDAFRCLCDARGRPPGPASVVIRFLSNLAVSVASGQQGSLSSDFLNLWGLRIQDALHHIDPGIGDVPQNTQRVLWNALSVSASAMQGRFDEAITGANLLYGYMEYDLEDAHRADILHVYTILAHSIHQHAGPLALFDLLMQEADTVYMYIHQPRRFHDHHLARSVDSFTATTLDLLSTIEDPVQCLRDAMREWSKTRLSIGGILILRALSRTPRVAESHAVFRLLRRENVLIAPEDVLLVVRGLIKQKSYDVAKDLLSTVSSYGKEPSSRPFYDYNSTALWLYARLGEVDDALEHFIRLAQCDRAKNEDRSSLLYAYAVTGDPVRAVELFRTFFPDPSIATPKNQAPNIVHYTNVILAYARVGDIDGVNEWIREMSEAGITPDLHVYNIVLEAFASRGDMQTMSTLLDQLRDNGFTPNHFIYTTIISAFAHRRDPIGAERIFKRALEEGVVPDRAMTTAIMNAHVEAGSWDGVIRAFDYLNTADGKGAGLTIEVFNTLMKAYVLIGAPFRTVANLFRHLERVNLRPDARTFALLIQSACDSRFMDIAEDLYVEMQRLCSEEQQTSLKANVYVLTILMSGYLRLNMRMKAKEFFDQIKENNLKSTALTYAAILNAYGEQRHEGGMQAAEDVLTSIMDEDPKSWMQDVGGRRFTLETVYRPLLHAYTQRDQPPDVERLYDDMVKQGGQPTLGALAQLMDAYRRMGDVEAVQSLWPDIRRLAKEYVHENALLTELGAGQQNVETFSALMCVPFSIYIDALSVAGKHDEVAAAWKELRAEGLQFDSHNWNHLVVALVRAGEPVRAFDVVEKGTLREKMTAMQEALPALKEESDPIPLLDNMQWRTLNSVGQRSQSNMASRRWQSPGGIGPSRAQNLNGNSPAPRRGRVPLSAILRCLSSFARAT